jgi:hypothetical protein
MRALAIALLSASGALFARPSLADSARTSRPVGVSLVVDRGPGTEQCIDAAALEQGVEARLHRTAFLHQGVAPLRIGLRLKRRGRHDWSAELRLESESGENLGERKLRTTAAHCSALDDSLALVVALLVDAPLGEREREIERASATSPASPPTQTPTKAELPIRAPKATTIELPSTTIAPRQPWHWEATAAASLALGLLPGLGTGFALGLSAQPSAGPELRLFGEIYAARDAHEGPAQAGARFSALFVGLEVCPLAAQLGGLRVAACAGQNLGRLHATAFGYDQNWSANDLLYTLLARGELVIPLSGRLSARLSGRAEFPLSRPVFYYGAPENAERDVFELSPTLAVLEAGLSIAL